MEKDVKSAPTGESTNFFQDTVNTFRSIIVSPREFFDAMPLEGGLKDPVLFMLIVSVASSLGILLITMKPLQALQELIVRILISFVSSAYLLVLSRGFGGTGSFEGTYRAFAYASAPMMISWIPFLNLIAAIYGLFLMRLGLERAHGLPTPRAIGVIAIWLVTMIGLAVIIAFMTAATIVRARDSGVPGI